MKSTAVCVVRPPKADLARLREVIAVLARTARLLFARLFQGDERDVDVRRDLLLREGRLARHYSGCRADAQAAARGWKERLQEEIQRLRHRLSSLGACREKGSAGAGRWCPGCVGGGRSSFRRWRDPRIGLVLHVLVEGENVGDAVVRLGDVVHPAVPDGVDAEKSVAVYVHVQLV